MLKKYFYFLILVSFSFGVLGEAKPVHDAGLKEKKGTQLEIKKNILNSAKALKDAQVAIKRALIGCRRECDFCKDEKEKLTPRDVVDPGCPEGGYAAGYACQRMQECMEQYDADRKEAKEKKVQGKDIVGTEFNSQSVLNAYNTVANQVIGAVKIGQREDLHKDYPPTLNHPPKQGKDDMPDAIAGYQKKEAPLIAAFRQRRVATDEKETVLGYLRNPENSPQQKLAFVSLRVPDDWNKTAGSTNMLSGGQKQQPKQDTTNKLRRMKELIMRTYFNDKTGCYGDQKCYQAYRTLDVKDKKKVLEAGTDLQTLYHNLRRHYIEELSIDSLSVFAAMHVGQQNNQKFYEHPALGKMEKWGGSYLDDILYNTDLMRGVYLQTAMETLAELRLLELNVARLLLDGNIDLAVHPSYLDEYQKETTNKDLKFPEKPNKIEIWKRG